MTYKENSNIYSIIIINERKLHKIPFCQIATLIENSACHDHDVVQRKYFWKFFKTIFVVSFFTSQCTIKFYECLYMFSSSTDSTDLMKLQKCIIYVCFQWTELSYQLNNHNWLLYLKENNFIFVKNIWKITKIATKEFFLMTNFFFYKLTCLT